VDAMSVACDREFHKTTVSKVIEHQGDKTRELSKERRDKWSANISRADIKPSNLDNIRVCSDHLIEGNYGLNTRTFYIFIFK
jgi:hypothetical protein